MIALRRSLIVLKNNKALSLIGLATKAGKTVSGEFSTEKSIKTGKGYLAIVAGDSSDNTKKKFRNMCEFYEVPLYILSDKETLGHAWARNSVPAWLYRTGILQKLSGRCCRMRERSSRAYHCCLRKRPEPKRKKRSGECF
mgnify:FL=1